MSGRLTEQPQHPPSLAVPSPPSNPLSQGGGPRRLPRLSSPSFHPRTLPRGKVEPKHKQAAPPSHLPTPPHPPAHHLVAPGGIPPSPLLLSFPFAFLLLCTPRAAGPLPSFPPSTVILPHPPNLLIPSPRTPTLYSPPPPLPHPLSTHPPTLYSPGILHPMR